MLLSFLCQMSVCFETTAKKYHITQHYEYIKRATGKCICGNSFVHIGSVERRPCACVRERCRGDIYRIWEKGCGQNACRKTGTAFSRKPKRMSVYLKWVMQSIGYAKFFGCTSGDRANVVCVCVCSRSEYNTCIRCYRSHVLNIVCFWWMEANWKWEKNETHTRTHTQTRTPAHQQNSRMNECGLNVPIQ